MAALADENQGNNGYINIPVELFRTFYEGEDAGFDNFLLHILAWGFATKQIAELDLKTKKVTEFETGGPSSEIINEWIGYINAIDDFNFIEVVSKYRTLLKTEPSEWMSNWHSAIVGVTFKAFNSMLRMDCKSERERLRTEHCWLTYLALKSIIGHDTSTRGNYTWDNIMNRALGFNSLSKNPCEGNENDWTAQFRCGKARRNQKKKDLIKRLTESWGLKYSPKDPKTGKNRKIPYFELTKRGYRN